MFCPQKTETSVTNLTNFHLQLHMVPLLKFKLYNGSEDCHIQILQVTEFHLIPTVWMEKQNANKTDPLKPHSLRCLRSL